jgi:hypothetical protein
VVPSTINEGLMHLFVFDVELLPIPDTWKENTASSLIIPNPKPLKH